MLLGVLPLVGRGDLSGPRADGVEPIERGLELLRAIADEVVVVREPADLTPSLERAELVVVHEPLCAVVSPTFVADVVGRARASGRPHAAVRPVVETIKQTEDGRVVATIDRDGLRLVCTPVVASGAAMAAVMDVFERLGDLARLIEALGAVELIDAPASAEPISVAPSR